MAIKAKISDSTTGPAQVSVTVPAQVQVDINNTDDLSEGSTNLYYTEAKATASIVNQLQDIQSTGLATLLNGDINISPHGTGNVNITSNVQLTGAGKNIIFEGDTADSFETTLTVTDPTTDRIITLPNATDTLVGKATTDTLTNKTLTTPIITEIDSGSTITLDAETDIVLDARGGDIYFKDNGTTFGSVTNAGGNLTIKNGATTALTFSGANTTVVGNLTVDGTTTFTGGSITLGDAATDTIAFTGTITGNLVFEGSTVDSFETTLAPGNPTGDITLSLPSTATDTLVAKNTTDTLTNKTLTTPTINTINATTFTVNASADIVLDADGADIKLKDSGTNFGRFTNSGGELVIKSGSSATTAATFSGANTTLAGTVNSGAITSTGIVTGSFFVATSGSIIFEGTTDDSFETTLQVVDPDVDRTILLPNASDTLIGKATTDTLTNKTLTTPVIAEIDSGSTITLDATTDIVLDADGGDVFFKDGGTTFGSATNTSGNLILKSGTTTAATFSGANITLAGTVGSGAITSTGIITGSFFVATSGSVIFEGTTDDSFETTLQVVDPDVDRTLLLPNASDTLIGKATTDTLTNKSIDLGTNTLTGSVAEFNAALQSESFTTLTGSETLTNKILTSPVINTPTVGTSLTLLTAGTIIFEGATADSFETTLTVTDPTVDRTLTLPNATDTLIGKATTDTLTNKTLTSPVLNTSVSGTAFLDEDNMASNSATKLASQQSIKAYVDTVMLTEDTLAEMNDTNITSPADASLLLYDTGTSTWRDGAMSGDATIGDTGAITFTTVNSNVGQFGSATAIPVVTVNAKGLVTAVATSSITTSLTIGADTGSNDAVALASDVLDISGGTNITTTVSNNDISVALDASPSITNLTLAGTVIFEGASADSFETTLTVEDPTADRTITLPNESFKIASFENMVVANGDNSTVNFTVATGYHLNQFLVTLNGVIQEPTADFTYSGATLTMGTAPITGDRLTIRY